MTIQAQVSAFGALLHNITTQSRLWRARRCLRLTPTFTPAVFKSHVHVLRVVQAVVCIRKCCARHKIRDERNLGCLGVKVGITFSVQMNVQY
jgi:hypothetical protein